MVLPTLLFLLLLAQGAALVTAIRRRLYTRLPAWSAYIFFATLHLIAGWLNTRGALADYPKVLFYLEPILLLGQISVTFESALRYLGVLLKGSSVENRLIIWLFVLVPTAVLLPIEIGTVTEALANYDSRMEVSIKLLYALRESTALTLVLVLVAIAVAAKLAGKRVPPTMRFHHFLLVAYLLGTVVGLGTGRIRLRAHELMIQLCFLVNPALCYALWSWRMWHAKPQDFSVAPAPAAPAPDPNDPGFERHPISQPS